MRRRRFQKGSLQLRRHGDTKVWVIQFYDARQRHRYHTLGPVSEIRTRSAAEKLRDDFMRKVNLDIGSDRGPVLLSDFITAIYLPFKRRQWKGSTAGTSENRIQHHIVKDLGSESIEDFTLSKLQLFLEQKAATGLSFSVIDHLRWDLSSIFEMAIAEKVLDANPATSLYTPRTAKKGKTRAMTGEQALQAIAAVELREKAILSLAIFVGMRPGEILGLQRRHVSAACDVIGIEQRVYRGAIDTPKTDGSARQVAVGSSSAEVLKRWMDSAVGPEPDVFVFAGESGRPVWRDTLLYDHIRPRLKPLGLEWVDFQVMRTTNASLGHEAKVDPKTSADQRGHTIDVSMNVYTRTSIEKKAAAAKQLENSVLRKKKVVGILEKRKRPVAS